MRCCIAVISVVAAFLAGCREDARAEERAAAAPATQVVAARPQVTVVTPKRDNLQYLSFWVAAGGGLFAKHGVDVRVVSAGPDKRIEGQLDSGQAQAAVVSPPKYLQMIADGAPIVLVANLLANDGIDLILRRDVAEARGIDRAQPVAERLRALKGLKIGVASGPPTRLRALFAASGLDADRDVTIVTLHGDAQNEAFGAKEVDGLYAHTPYLERALVEQDAVIVVDQSAGEVPELANRQIHALVVTRDVKADVVEKMVAAIGEAQALVRSDRDAAVAAVMAQFPELDRRRVERIVEVYAPAMPSSPVVSVAGLARELQLFPASGTAPDLSAIDLARHVR
jgi:NitT/TauT family transport system substrate-binding protein